MIKAYRLRDRASDVERFCIDTLYDREVTGNLERQSRRTWNRGRETYPRDPVGLTACSRVSPLRSTGRHELSIAAADKALALDPDMAPPTNQRYHQLV